MHHIPLPGADSFIVVTHDPTNPFYIFENLQELQHCIIKPSLIRTNLKVMQDRNTRYKWREKGVRRSQ
jgi:hypothetical protein